MNSISARSSLLLFAAVPFFASAAELSNADREQLKQVVGGLMALTAVDLGNCQSQYPDFDDGYMTLLDGGISDKLKRLIDHYAIAVTALENVEHDPTHAQCMDVLGKARMVYATNAALIQRLSAALPETEAH